MKTLDLRQAADFLFIHPVTLRNKVRSGEIPGSKPGKRWIFIDIDLVEYLRAQYTRRVSQGDNQEERECHSINARTRPIDGSSSPSWDEQYKAALGLPKG